MFTLSRPNPLFLMQVAKDFFGRTSLDGSLNGDEAAALGATL